MSEVCSGKQTCAQLRTGFKLTTVFILIYMYSVNILQLSHRLGPPYVSCIVMMISSSSFLLLLYDLDFSFSSLLLLWLRSPSLELFFLFLLSSSSYTFFSSSVFWSGVLVLVAVFSNCVFASQPRSPRPLSSCCPHVLGGWESIWPPPTLSSSMTPTGTPTTTFRYVALALACN